MADNRPLADWLNGKVVLAGLLAVLCCAGAAAQDGRQQLGVGYEAGFRFHQEQTVVQRGSSTVYDLTGTGDPRCVGLDSALTVSWDLTLISQVAVGLRAAVVVAGPSTYWFVPRFNARIKYEFNDALAAVLEFPYSPGLGLELGKQISVFVGTDNLLVSKSDFTVTCAVLYLVPL